MRRFANERLKFWRLDEILELCHRHFDIYGAYPQRVAFEGIEYEIETENEPTHFFLKVKVAEKYLDQIL